MLTVLFFTTLLVLHASAFRDEPVEVEPFDGDLTDVEDSTNDPEILHQQESPEPRILYQEERPEPRILYQEEEPESNVQYKEEEPTVPLSPQVSID
ncbi:hypothetical protein RB195_008482 [Necator americanus]|uniref:Secreted protein n=1 Tax=Necator americanus TaxID=51031 RepID=A0ABR1CNV3_NECAM